MFDIGVTKLAIIGGIALVVIGPERLPTLARTLGTLLGRARRYVADVKAEVDRSMELEALRKMRDTVETAARGVEQNIQAQAAEFEKTWAEVNQELAPPPPPAPLYPTYRRPNKHWRLKQGATPRWFKLREGMRTHVQSGAARVARHRPRRTV